MNPQTSSDSSLSLVIDPAVTQKQIDCASNTAAYHKQEIISDSSHTIEFTSNSIDYLESSGLCKSQTYKVSGLDSVPTHPSSDSYEDEDMDDVSSLIDSTVPGFNPRTRSKIAWNNYVDSLHVNDQLLHLTVYDRDFAFDKTVFSKVDSSTLKTYIGYKMAILN